MLPLIASSFGSWSTTRSDGIRQVSEPEKEQLECSESSLPREDGDVESELSESVEIADLCMDISMNLWYSSGVISRVLGAILIAADGDSSVSILADAFDGPWCLLRWA